MITLKDLDRSQWSISSPLHNKLAEEDRPIHAWYRFVLSFPPHLVRQYLSKFEMSPGDTVLDPFCGTGTTIVECKKQDIGAIGFEANPMAALATRVKSNWTIWGSELERVAEWAASQAQNDIDLCFKGVPAFRAGVSKDQLTLYGWRTLDDDAYKLLLANSISDKPLHRALVLRLWIAKAPSELIEPLQLALAWTLVVHAGNIRFGPEVGITPPKEDCDVVGLWLEQCRRMATDLAVFGDRQHIPTQLIQADARDVSQLEDKSISAVVTSPPYPNEKDYTRTTRLETVVLGLIKNKADLRALKQGLLRSNTRNVYVNDRDDSFVADVPEIQRIARDIEARRIEMGKNSGFERLYHRVTKLYFGGMARHLQSLQPKLKPGALLGYVVGDQASYLQIQIRTGQLLAEIAERQGYEVVDVDLFRTRLATATKQQLREEVVVLRWNG
ncbi:MAG: DNA methyltransferase [Fimbriimonadaceae bacterium]